MQFWKKTFLKKLMSAGCTIKLAKYNSGKNILEKKCKQKVQEKILQFWKKHSGKTKVQEKIGKIQHWKKIYRTGKHQFWKKTYWKKLVITCRKKLAKYSSGKIDIEKPILEKTFWKNRKFWKNILELRRKRN